MLTNHFPHELAGVSVEVLLRATCATGSAAATSPRGEGDDARVADALDALFHPDAAQGGGGVGGGGEEEDGSSSGGAGADASGAMLLLAQGVRLRPGLNRVAVRGQLAQAGDFTVDRIEVRYGKMVLVESLRLVYGHFVLRVRSERAPVQLALQARGRRLRPRGRWIRRIFRRPH